jgi:hypothetical protein
MKTQKIFQILDADTNVGASLMSAEEPDATEFVVISRPDNDPTIVLSLADFRRLAAAVERHTV